MKVCTQCGVEKPRSDFYADKKKSDGLYSRCKPCHLQAAKKWKDANAQKVASDEAARYERDKARILAVGALWAKKNSERIRLRKMALRHANPEKYAQKARERRAKNPEKNRAYQREDYWANREKRLEIQRAYKMRNPEVLQRHEVARRTAKQASEPTWSVEFFVAEAYRLAALRKKCTGIQWHVDHIVPLRSKVVCGLHAHTNIQVIPALINQSKSNRYWPDMP